MVDGTYTKPHNTRISSVRTSEADTNAKVLHGHNRPTTSTTIRTVAHNLSTSLRRPRKLAEEQLILNVPANSLGSEPSATTKIPRHQVVHYVILNPDEYLSASQERPLKWLTNSAARRLAGGALGGDTSTQNTRPGR